MERRIVEGVELAAHATGTPGGRPIVLLHGLTGNARDWSQTVKPLVEAGWRVLSPDLPGHVESEAPKTRRPTGWSGWRTWRMGWRPGSGSRPRGWSATGDCRLTLPDLAKLRCKTLVVCCEHEAPFLSEVCDRLAATIPGAAYEIIPRAWHSPQLENAPAFNRVLLAFLERL